MRRSEVLRWLEEHGGQADYQVEYETIDNPRRTSRTDPEKITQKRVTWTANDGQKLTVLDRGEVAAVPDESTPDLVDITGEEPVYEVVGQGEKPPAERTDPRSEEERRHEAQLDAERRKNRGDPNWGRWQTDAERRRDEEEIARRDREREAQERENALREREIAIREAEAERAGRREQADIGQRQTQTEVERERIGIERDRYQLERERANRPEIVSRPTDEDESIAVFNPVSSTVEAQDNPLYNEAKTNAKRKQEELALAIQQNRMTAEQAAAEYTRWFKETVEVPFLRAAEARAQATERRQALEAEDRRREFSARYEFDRQKFGQEAGQSAIENELSLLPYRVGPAFGEQMSSAINSLAGGGRMDTNASAGINFTADAFEFKRPNLEKISRKATAAALRHLTPYASAVEPYTPADYSGINLPTPEAMQTAPAAPSYIDTSSAFHEATGGRYRGPTP